MSLTRVESGPEPDASFVALVQAFSLDPGEREALLVARARPSAWLLSDDAAARLAAELLGIRAHGTTGLLIRAIRRGRRTPADVITLVEQLPARSSPACQTGASSRGPGSAATRVSSSLTDDRRLHRAA